MQYANYINTYLDEVGEIARTIDRAALHRAIEALRDLRARKGRLFVIGVGGSAANASHAVNDFRKMCKIECYTPVDNVAELTAWTNDNSFDVIFAHWLEGSHLTKNDAVMVLSVGGGSDKTSRNIVHAVEYAKKIGSKVIGIVSRDGGTTRKLADVTVLVPIVHDARITAHAEEWQHVVWHLFVNALHEHHPAEPYSALA